MERGKVLDSRTLNSWNSLSSYVQLREPLHNSCFGLLAVCPSRSHLSGFQKGHLKPLQFAWAVLYSFFLVKRHGWIKGVNFGGCSSISSGVQCQGEGRETTAVGGFDMPDVGEYRRLVLQPWEKNGDIGWMMDVVLLTWSMNYVGHLRWKVLTVSWFLVAYLHCNFGETQRNTERKGKTCGFSWWFWQPKTSPHLGV